MPPTKNVPQALSGYRPRVALTGSVGYQYNDSNFTQGGSPTAIVRTEVHGANPPRSGGLTVSQTLYNGNVSANKTRAAESQVSGAREALRVLEQTVLLSAATIYMDYLRDAAIVEVQRSNVRVLEETLKQTRDRFFVGEVTRTDVAQSEAQLAAGKTQLLAAEANLVTTRANFRRIIGNEPEALAPGSPVDRLMPATLPGAVELSLIENPNVTAAMYGIDVNFLQVKVNEGALLPTVTMQASVQQSYEQSLQTYRSFVLRQSRSFRSRFIRAAPVLGRFASPRETLARRHLARADPRPGPREHDCGLGTAGGQQGAGRFGASTGDDVEDSARWRSPRGQAGRSATTLDVLNAQQALVNARIALVTAQHDRVAASYGVLNSVGRLSPRVLDLAITVYDPSVHYQQVRDSWFGIRTPDGR